MYTKTGIIVKTVLLLVFGLLFNSAKLSGQQNKIPEKPGFKNAVGIRFGGTTGITYKYKFNAYNGLEMIFGTYPHAIGITGLYERSILTNIDGLNVNFGAGGHISRAYYSTWGYTYNSSNDQYYYYSRNYHYGPVIGIDAIGGIEYKFRDTPIALSFDLKPYIEFYHGHAPYGRMDPGLGIKFTF